MSKLGPRIPRQQKSRSRDLRKEAPIPERILWGLLRNQQICGLKFRRQHPVGPFITDFCCVSAMLVVELDGLSHVGRGEADDARTRRLEQLGYRVIRAINDDVLNHSEAVVEMIARAAGFDGIIVTEPKKKRREDPHPGPLPKKGEGV